MFRQGLARALRAMTRGSAWPEATTRHAKLPGGACQWSSAERRVCAANSPPRILDPRRRAPRHALSRSRTLSRSAGGDDSAGTRRQACRMPLLCGTTARLSPNRASPATPCSAASAHLPGGRLGATQPHASSSGCRGRSPHRHRAARAPVRRLLQCAASTGARGSVRAARAARSRADGEAVRTSGWRMEVGARAKAAEWRRRGAHTPRPRRWPSRPPHHHHHRPSSTHPPLAARSSRERRVAARRAVARVSQVAHSAAWPRERKAPRGAQRCRPQPPRSRHPAYLPHHACRASPAVPPALPQSCRAERRRREGLRAGETGWRGTEAPALLEASRKATPSPGARANDAPPNGILMQHPALGRRQ